MYSLSKYIGIYWVLIIKILNRSRMRRWTISSPVRLNCRLIWNVQLRVYSGWIRGYRRCRSSWTWCMRPWWRWKIMVRSRIWWRAWHVWMVLILKSYLIPPRISYKSTNSSLVCSCCFKRCGSLTLILVRWSYNWLQRRSHRSEHNLSWIVCLSSRRSWRSTLRSRRLHFQGC